MQCDMVDTSGTRYKIDCKSGGVCVFRGWEDFVESVGLKEFDDFLYLNGQVVDRNKRSVVYQLELGNKKEIFYIKIHRNYFKKGLNTFFKKIPYCKIELNSMMHYARAGLDELEPVAYGWRPGKEDVGFLLIKELKNYQSLKDWIKSPECVSRKERQSIAKAVATMLYKMHQNGIAHIDLFSWHVFIKKEDGYVAHPIDLERTKLKGNWPWSGWLFLWNRATDLAVLHLTVPWPQIGFAERMKFFQEYCRLCDVNVNKRFFLKLILVIARNRGRKKKFYRYGVSRLYKD